MSFTRSDHMCRILPREISVYGIDIANPTVVGPSSTLAVYGGPVYLLVSVIALSLTDQRTGQPEFSVIKVVAMYIVRVAHNKEFVIVTT